MIDKLLRKKVRVIIPVDEESNDFIEIKNPNNYVIGKVKERVLNRINGTEEFDNEEILEFLIKELTNVEMNIPLSELLSQDISYECKMLLYNINEIFNEIHTEILCVVKMEIAKKKSDKLEEEIAIEMQQV